MLKVAHREVSIEPPEDLQFSRRGSALIGQKMFEVLEMARVLEDRGTRVYHLELGNPRLAPPPELTKETLRSLEDEDVGYAYSAGHPVLRKAIANWYSTNGQRKVTEANIIISPANLIINQFLDLVCNPGDPVVFFTPAFPTYWAAATHIGLNVISVALDPRNGFDLTGESVAQAIASRPKAIIVNSANNPTGAVYSKSVLDLLAQECDKHGIWLLSDETYGPICFGKEFYSLAELELPRLVIMSSFSKIFSVPGYRTGFALAHQEVAAKLSLSTSTLISCLPIFTQLGCAAAMDKFKFHTDQIAQRCKAISAWCTQVLQNEPRIQFNHPNAGFYYFLDIRSTKMNDLLFSKRLLEEKHTAVTPGSSFGPAYNHFIRIATCGLEEDVQEGTRRLVGFVGHQ